jgi:fatty-acyl-CoA synthase
MSAIDAPRLGGFSDLSPVAFLQRSARVFAPRVAITGDSPRLTYGELNERVERLAGVLRDRVGDDGARVATLLPNVSAMLEAQYAVAGLGNVLVPINTRLASSETAYILAHSGARCLIADEAFGGLTRDALAALPEPPSVIWFSAGEDSEYERLLGAASRLPLGSSPEAVLLSINYTSGTTGRPKGVMYSHRGSYLQTLGVIAECRLSASSRYLWTLPMFHCHGWHFTWAVSAMGGTHVCLREFDPARVWRYLSSERVTHLCGAPTVLTMLIGSHDAVPRDSAAALEVFTGGAPPSPALLKRCTKLGWHVSHLYGLTETYGPLGVCEWHPEWDALDADEAARLKARQGVGSVVSRELRVVGPDGRDVPADGQTMGEVVMLGNNVTMGYYRDREATAAAFSDGWFHSGDLAVMHPDGYIELRDRLKDIIISGGENISSIEVEQTLTSHDAVADVAVVAVPDEVWGERPKAFVVPAPGASVSTEELMAFARSRLAKFKVPREIELCGELPKTSTGKIQKFMLRESPGTPPAFRE